MSQRKPPGTSFRSWIDRQIDDARDRGEFDELPGAGKPIPGLDKPYDEMWWVKQKLRREHLSYLPPSLALRKAAHDALLEAAEAKSEGEVRRILAAVNRQIVEANRRPSLGPALMLVPFNAESVLRRWRAGEPLQPGGRRPAARGYTQLRDAEAAADDADRAAKSARGDPTARGTLG